MPFAPLETSQATAVTVLQCRPFTYRGTGKFTAVMAVHARMQDIICLARLERMYVNIARFKSIALSWVDYAC